MTLTRTFQPHLATWERQENGSLVARTFRNTTNNVIPLTQAVAQQMAQTINTTLETPANAPAAIVQSQGGAYNITVRGKDYIDSFQRTFPEVTVINAIGESPSP